MKRALLPTENFRRCAKRLIGKNPDTARKIEKLLTALAEDAFHPSLKTHKLKGELKGSWAASGGYDLRVVFQFVKHQGADSILLEAIGTHDEVY